MGRKRSKSAAVDLNVKRLFLGVVLICTAPFSHAATTPADVAAINNLFVALGSPVLPGWVASAGDPCGELWQGVQCNNSDILSITLNGVSLGGELGDSLGSFTSIRTIDLSSNNIGGSIPSTLPTTIQNLFLAANLLSGSIPATLSSLPQLQAMSLNNNQLSGELPDAFESLTSLVNLDLSSNNFSGHLPLSMENLSSVKTLRLQNNHLSGTLDVLQDLPLQDLNIENNLFSGPIPEKLLTIPKFSKDGNPFNTSSSLSPSPSPPSLSPSSTPPFFGPGTSSPSNKTSPSLANGTSSTPSTNGTKNGGKGSSNKRVVWISIASVLSFVAIILALILCLPACLRRRHEEDRIAKRYDIGAFEDKRENPRNNVPPPVKPPGGQDEKDSPRETGVKLTGDRQPERKNPVVPVPKRQVKREENQQKFASIPKQEDHEIDISRLDPFFMPRPPPPPPPPGPPPPPPLPPLLPEIILTPIVAEEGNPMKKTSPIRPPFPISARSYTIASLQQFTNSFSQDNLIGSGTLGNVYRAELPDGKLLAVKKLDKRASSQQKDVEFLELVNGIDKIRHANVVELMGYCAEHGQRLLIFEYCSNGTLQDALRSDDELKKKLSWNTRIRMALGAARALEYLHEVCQPPIIHRNFKSTNVLLDDDLGIRVSDCGLSPLISSGAVSQLSGQLLTAYGYGAPEFESGIYTTRSDVFSFGVVMLELLTARKSYDRNRNRGEQSLVRWAIPQLHDIDALSRMVDPAIDGQYTAKSLSRFADIISRCVQSEPEFRPPMSEVVQDLVDMITRERSP